VFNQQPVWAGSEREKKGGGVSRPCGAWPYDPNVFEVGEKPLMVIELGNPESWSGVRSIPRLKTLQDGDYCNRDSTETSCGIAQKTANIHCVPLKRSNEFGTPYCQIPAFYITD